MNLFSLIQVIVDNLLNRDSRPPDSERAVEPVSPPIFDEDKVPELEVKQPEAKKPEVRPIIPRPTPSRETGPWKFIQPPNAPYRVINGIIIGNLHNGNPHLSPNFAANEFACACCKEYRIEVRLLEALQQLRTNIGQVMRIALTTLESSVNPGGSGYRCPRHNSRIRGASPNSRHMQGTAADISCPSLPIARLVQHVEAIPLLANGGIGTYATFVHVDTGPRRRWSS